jgi:microcystin-dependent protein
MIQAFAGSTAPQGWHLCDGTVLEQADYAQLFANIGSTWDTFAHPVDGTPTVGGSQFALPNLKGLYLAGSGDAGGDARSLGVFQNDATDQNGLTVSGGTASGTFASSSHTHSPGSMSTEVIVGNGLVFQGSTTSKSWTSSKQVNVGSYTTTPTTINAATPVEGTSGSNSSSASVSNTPASISASDNETRPKTAPINYIIKLYDDEASVSMSQAAATASTLGTIKLDSSFAGTGEKYGLSYGKLSITNAANTLLTNNTFNNVGSQLTVPAGTYIVSFGTNFRLASASIGTGSAPSAEFKLIEDGAGDLTGASFYERTVNLPRSVDGGTDQYVGCFAKVETVVLASETIVRMRAKIWDLGAGSSVQTAEGAYMVWERIS